MIDSKSGLHQFIDWTERLLMKAIVLLLIFLFWGIIKYLTSQIDMLPDTLYMIWMGIIYILAMLAYPNYNYDIRCIAWSVASVICFFIGSFVGSKLGDRIKWTYTGKAFNYF